MRQALLFIACLAAGYPMPSAAWTIDVRCSGGLDGRTRSARLTDMGELFWSPNWNVPLESRRRIETTEAATLSARLDKAEFDTMKSRPATGRSFDGLGCKIQRTTEMTHAVVFSAGGGSLTTKEKIVSDVMHEIMKLANPRRR